MGRFLDAAEIVLRPEDRPMKARELAETALALGLLDFSNGKTPHQTVKAKLSVDIRIHGPSSRFMRTGTGLFALRGHNDEEYIAPRFEKVIKPAEDVLVFPVSLLEKVGWFHGIRRDYGPYAEALLSPKNTFFMRRIDAETKHAYKQVISYVIVKRHGSILRFVRGSYSSVQSFLKGNFCIGFGGHVQSRDLKTFPLFAHVDSGYTHSVYRELSEELELPAAALDDANARIIGVLNDDSSDLGKLHFAFIHLLDLSDFPSITSAKGLKKERSINQLRFIPVEKLGSRFERYEYWSKLCIREFFGRKVRIPTHIHRVDNFRLRRTPRNIAIVGSIGSGKTEASQVLERRFGYSLISTGQLVQEMVGSTIDSVGRRAFDERSLALIRSASGPHRLAAAILTKIGQAGKQCVIDGLRNAVTFQILRKELRGNLALIFVDSTVENAYRFFRQRGDEDLTLREFLELLEHAVESEVHDLIQMANIVFYNHSGKRIYLSQIQRYFRSELL